MADDDDRVHAFRARVAAEQQTCQQDCESNEAQGERTLLPGRIPMRMK